jgi:hypothetical protein
MALQLLEASVKNTICSQAEAMSALLKELAGGASCPDLGCTSVNATVDLISSAADRSSTADSHSGCWSAFDFECFKDALVYILQNKAAGRPTAGCAGEGSVL